MNEDKSPATAIPVVSATLASPIENSLLEDSTYTQYNKST